MGGFSSRPPGWETPHAPLPKAVEWAVMAFIIFAVLMALVTSFTRAGSLDVHPKPVATPVATCSEWHHQGDFRNNNIVWIWRDCEVKQNGAIKERYVQWFPLRLK